MGYSTEFKGTLEFVNEPVARQLAYLKTILGEDCRDHPEWNAPGLYYIDLQLTNDYIGLEWDGSEKTYNMEELVNVVIRLMQEKWPDFGLNGKFFAQGEDIDDRWELIIENGKAIRRDVVFTGKKVRCPYCNEWFVIKDD